MDGWIDGRDGLPRRCRPEKNGDDDDDDDDAEVGKLPRRFSRGREREKDKTARKGRERISV